MKRFLLLVAVLYLFGYRPDLQACDPGERIRRINRQLDDPVDSARILYQGWGSPKSSEVSNYDGDCFPWRSADGRFLFFASINLAGPPRPGHQGGWDIYLSRWDSVHQRWEEPQNLGPNVNTRTAERRPCSTPRGDTLYFQRWSPESGEDIWMSTWDGLGWTPAESVPFPVSTRADDEHPALSFDGQRLYITSDRAGGHGGADIWMALRRNGAWDTIMNLGRPINSPNQESRPFESADRQRLYFCNDHGEPRPGPSYGGAGDIYVSFQEGDSWGPVHLVAAPVNNDLVACSPCESYDGRELWFGSQMLEGSRGDEDVWVAMLDSSFPPGPARGYANWLKTGELGGAIHVHDLHEGPDGTIYAATACADTAPLGRVFRTTDRGENWTPCGVLPGAMAVYCLLVSGDTLLAGTYPRGDVFRSSNRGDSWLNTAELPLATGARAIERIANGDLLAAASPYDANQENPLYRSTNDGLTWTEIASLPGINPCFFIRQVSTGTVFWGGWGIDSDVYIYRSTDNGATWDTTVTVPQFECEWTANDLLEHSDGSLYLVGWITSQRPGVGGGYVCRSTDDGLTWQMCTKIVRGDGTHSSAIYAVIEDVNGAVLVGMQPAYDSVVFASTDCGTTWHSTGGLDRTFECLSLLCASDGTIYAGTTPNGDVFRYALSDLDESPALPPRLETGISAPPGQLGIRYFVPERGNCEISLYDNTGRKIATILRQLQAAGAHRLLWDRRDARGSKVPAGSYVLRLRTGSGIARTRLTLVE